MWIRSRLPNLPVSGTRSDEMPDARVAAGPHLGQRTDMATARAKPPNGSAHPADLGSSAQRERRKRILDATLALASKGGYDAVQMPTVAERADVALGTLYRYFPSKIHLLVSALARELERVRERTERVPLPGA